MEKVPGAGNLPQKQLLNVEGVASFPEVGRATVWRCRDGSLPGMKMDRGWRVRRDALEEFLRRSERSETLTGRMGGFLRGPDDVLAIAHDRETMSRLDAAFFLAAEARGGTLVRHANVEEGAPTRRGVVDDEVR